MKSEDLIVDVVLGFDVGVDGEVIIGFFVHGPVGSEGFLEERDRFFALYV